MKRLLSTVVPVAALALVVVLVVAASALGKQPSSPRHHGHAGKTITVIEHAVTDATTDTGTPEDSAGDILTFANDVFDAADATKVGTDQGYCIRIVAHTSYECTWTTFLAGGQIVVAGPFYDAKDSTLAITGGTGRYSHARGTMELHSRAGGTKFAFVFRLNG
jgi:allene oxide cyclase